MEFGSIWSEYVCFKVLFLLEDFSVILMMIMFWKRLKDINVLEEIG